MSTTDRIEKKVTLRASVTRVWKALADSAEFGHWFGVKLEGDFAAGKSMRGTFGERINEAGIIEHQKKLGIKPSGVKIPEPGSVFCTVVRMDAERYFSFRWVPYGIDAEADPKNEPMTLVEFTLEKAPEGTLLTIVESGFDQVPAHRRERAFRMNEGGWAGQAKNLKKYVDGE